MLQLPSHGDGLQERGKEGRRTSEDSRVLAAGKPGAGVGELQGSEFRKRRSLACGFYRFPQGWSWSQVAWLWSLESSVVRGSSVVEGRTECWDLHSWQWQQLTEPHEREHFLCISEGRWLCQSLGRARVGVRKLALELCEGHEVGWGPSGKRLASSHCNIR